MFKGDLSIIRKFASRWSNHNMTRYYIDFNEIDGEVLHDVSVFFDTHGILHIINASPHAAKKIEEYIESRYIEEVKWYMLYVRQWWKLLKPYASLKGNIIEIAYKNDVFRINHDIFSEICAKSSVGRLDSRFYVFDCPSCLDRIVENLLLDLDRTDSGKIEYEDFHYKSNGMYYDHPLFPLNRPPIESEDCTYPMNWFLHW